MCVVSMIGDAWREQFPQRWPQITTPEPDDSFNLSLGMVTREEFDRLKAEVEELKNLLIAAKRFDEKTGQPDCEMDEKTQLIKRIAQMVGVDIEDVFKSSE